MNINKVILVGRVTKKPEAKTLPSGSVVCSFSLATNRVWNEKGSNTKKEETTFHNVVAFGKTAQTIAQYVVQGQELFVEGRIMNRSWEGSDGKKNYRTEIMVDTFQFGQKPSGAARTTTAAAQTAPEDLDSIEYPDEEINLEDIPF